VEKDGPEFLFGQIMARLTEGDKVMGNLTEQVKEVTKAVYRLPCAVHEEKIKELQVRQYKRNNKSEKQSEISLNLKHGLLIAITSIMLSALVGFLMSLIVRPI